MRAHTHDTKEVATPGADCPLEDQLVFEATNHEIKWDPGDPDMQQMSHMSRKPSAKVSFSDHPYSGEANIAEILSQNTRQVTQVSHHDTYLPRGDWEVSVHDITSSDDPHDQDVPSVDERLQEQLDLHPHGQNVAERVDLTEEQQTPTI